MGARPPVLIGERVLWLGSGSGLPKSGTAKWIGRLPEMGPDWAVGLELDEALPFGGIDGTWNNRKLFVCKHKHGLIVPHTSVIPQPTHKRDPLHTTVAPRIVNMTATFKYFAYGSNLLAQRIHVSNPSAERSGDGQLAGWRLDFGEYEAKRWGGHAATIVADEASTVWGAIWDVGVENLADLDRQEGVDKNIYRVLDELPVKTNGGQIVKCRSYCLVKQPGAAKPDGTPSYLPSKIYLDTIIRGARETGLPSDYIAKLEAFPHNGYDGPFDYSIQY